MAGLTPDLRITSQIRLFGWLRLRMFTNALRTSSAKAELASRIVLGLLGALFALGGGFGMGAAAYFMTKHQPEALSIPLWTVFGVWQLLPMFAGAFSVEFEFSSLLRFPLRFPAFYILALAYGLFDFSAVAAIVWLTGIGTGIALARPDLILPAAAILFAFAAVNLFLGRVIFSWLVRLLGQRRTRERFLIVMVLLSVLPQFLSLAAQRWGDQLAPVLRVISPAALMLPPSIAAHGIAAAAGVMRLQPNLTVAGACLLGLAAYATGLGLLLRRRLLHQYRGEELGESEAARRSVAGEKQKLSSGMFLPGLPGTVAAMVEKELLYLFRSGQMLMVTFFPLLMVVFFLFSFGGSGSSSQFLRRMPELVYPSMVGYALLVVMPFSMNAFAFDGRGIQLLLAAPVRFREVLLGKNLVMGGIIMAQGLAVWPLIALLVAPPRVATVLTTLAMLLLATLLNFTVGNILSLYAPRAYDFGKFRQRQSGVGMLSSLGVQIVIAAIAVGVFLVARWYGSMWLAATIFLVLALVLLPVYSAVLDYCTDLAERRREKLTSELCRQQ